MTTGAEGLDPSQDRPLQDRMTDDGVVARWRDGDAFDDAPSAPHAAPAPRPPASRYALVFFDPMQVKIREHGTVAAKPVYPLLGVRPDGSKDILAVLIETGPKIAFWRAALAALKRRHLRDLMIAVTDGSPEIAAATAETFPDAHILAGIAVLGERSLRRIPTGDRSRIAAEIDAIVAAETAEAGASRLENFAAGEFGRLYPSIVADWRRHWCEAERYFALPQAIRAIVCANAAAKSISAKLRRRDAKARSHFASNREAIDHLTRQMSAASTEWKVSPRQWNAAREDFVRMFGRRFAS